MPTRDEQEIPRPQTCEEADALATNAEELEALLVRLSRERQGIEGARALLRLIDMDEQTLGE